MGNSHSGHKSSKNSSSCSASTATKTDASETSSQNHSTSILKLFEKMELTADDGNTHPGELSRVTFENAFHGPLHKFGKLMYRQMKNGHVDSDRITREEFVEAGTEIVSTINVADQRRYYYRLFAKGKEHLTREEAYQMVQVSFMLTVSLSKIPHQDDERDNRLFEGMVAGMFGIHEQLNYESADKWLLAHCPNMFAGVHSWVCTVLGGSNLPSEMEANKVRVPQLENFKCGQHCLSLGMAWALSAVLPNCYTTLPTPPPAVPTPGTAGPHVNPWQHIVSSLAGRLPRVQSWCLLYNSERDGMSKNRFSHHVMSYHGPNLVFLSFEGGNLYCLALDMGFREGVQKFGGRDCCLIQLLPVYRVVQSGPKIVLFNSLTRGVPKGILIGQDHKPLVLKLDEDFDRIYHYDVPCALHRIEAWGCGGEEVKQAQVKQKQWEAKDVERERTRKLRLEGDWRENPDKQILEWGGVKTGSSYLSSR
ncbi:uncharacterized protein LOC143288541 [Babylonia areolata]|uniref:uncharacterized protein LOC143288541 n=1 Tax=Babylonia areolata TaxID=304850 RepID=UPI003FD69416